MANENINYGEDDKKVFTPPEEKAKAFGKWVVGKLPTIFAILIAVFFIFNGAVEVLPTSLGLKEQIIMSFINILAGYSITSLIAEGGFKSAQESPAFSGESKRYNVKVIEGLKYREAIEQLSLERSIQNQKNYRIQICESASLYYWEIFDEDGLLRPEFDIKKYKKDSFYGKRKRAFKKAVNLRIHKVNVFGKASASSYGITKEVTESGYRAKNYITKIITKVLFGICSVGVMFNYIGISASSIIYAFMQIVMWFGLGIMDRTKNYNFVINTLMPQISSRRLIIEEFLGLEQNEKDMYISRALEEKNKYTTKKLTYSKSFEKSVEILDNK